MLPRVARISHDPRAEAQSVALWRVSWSASVVLCLWTGGSVLTGRAIGLLAGETVELAAAGHLTLLAGDLDANESPDLAVLNRDAASVEVLLNDGRGFLVNKTTFPTEATPRSLAAGRVNDDDEFVDIVAFSSGSFVTAFGDGTGLFPFAPAVRRGTSSHDLVADLDGDGRLDQVLRSSRAGIELFIPLSASESTPLPSPATDPRVFATGDFDGDGKRDLLVWSQTGPPHIVVFEGLGGGRFREPVVIERTPNPGGELLSAAVGDLDADARDEVILLARGDFRGRVLGFLYVVKRFGDGEYTAWRLGHELRLVPRDFEMTLGDLDGDLSADLVVRGMKSDVEEGYWVLRSAGVDTIVFGDVGFLQPSGESTSACAADFDADGMIELAVALSERGEVELISSPLSSRVSWNSTESCYVLSERFTERRVTHVATARLASKRRDGVVWAGDGAAGILVLEAGGLREIASFAAPSAVGSLATGDADGDADIDIVLTDPSGKAVEFHVLGADMQPERVVRVRLPSEPRGVTVPRLDRDEGWTAAVTFPLEDRVALFSPSAEGGFVETAQFPAGGSPAKVVSGDVDGDGATDLAILSAARGEVSVLVRTARGQFAPPIAARVLDDPADLAARDLDGDGRDEIVVASRSTDGLTVLTSQGDSLLPRFVALPHGSLPTSIALEDPDGNGELEVVLANSGSNAVMAIEKDASGNLGRDRILISRFGPVLPGAALIAAGDLVGNGWTDIVVGDTATGELRIYVSTGCGRQARFRRGDADGSGVVGLNDAITILVHLFASSELDCPDAGDADDDGRIGLADAVVTLSYLFSAGEEPRPPGPIGCGTDPTEDELHVCRSPCFEE